MQSFLAVTIVCFMIRAFIAGQAYLKGREQTSLKAEILSEKRAHASGRADVNLCPASQSNDLISSSNSVKTLTQLLHFSFYLVTLTGVMQASLQARLSAPQSYGRHISALFMLLYSSSQIVSHSISV